AQLVERSTPARDVHDRRARLRGEERVARLLALLNERRQALEAEAPRDAAELVQLSAERFERRAVAGRALDPVDRGVHATQRLGRDAEKFFPQLAQEFVERIRHSLAFCERSTQRASTPSTSDRASA